MTSFGFYNKQENMKNYSMDLCMYWDSVSNGVILIPQ